MTAAVGNATELYQTVERTFTSSRQWRNGFLEVDVDVTFTHNEGPATRIRLPAFWNGKDTSGRDRFTVRFAPTRLGAWTYRTHSAQDKSLDGLVAERGQSPEVLGVMASSKPGFIQRDGASRWKYSNGRRFFPVGTTIYEWVGTQIAEDPGLGFAVEFVRNHFNKVRLSYMSTRLADNAFGGQRKLSTKLENGFHWYSDFSEVNSLVINLEHWAKLDRIIHALQDAGVHVEIILARKITGGHQVQGNWIRGIGGSMGADGLRLIGDKGVRYFVARYAACPLLWWTIANEWPEPGLTPEDIHRLGEKIKELDPYAHPLSAHWNEDWLFGGQAWPTHGILQTHLVKADLAGLNKNVLELRRSHGIGFVNAEYGYEDREKTPNTPANVIRAHWAIVLAGGYGDYGHSPKRLVGKYMWGGLDYYWEKPGRPASGPASVADVAAGQDAAPALRAMRDWMNSGKVGFWRMEPANQLASGDAANRFCLAAPGAEYLVSGEEGALLVDLSAAAGRDLPVEELDPMTGELRARGSTRGVARFEYRVPAGRFVVLHIGSASGL